MDYVIHMLAHYPHLAGLVFIGPLALMGLVGVVGLLAVTVFSKT